MRPRTSPISPTLEQVRRDLAQWRQTRTHLGTPIPPHLWAAAVAVARRDGLYPTARALPIDYGALKQHVKATDDSSDTGACSEFVEFRPVVRPADGCVIEVEGPRSTVRVRLPHVGMPELARLARAIAGMDA